MKVIITLGLPASGKSTWARQLLESSSNILVLNRDSIRIMLGGKWTGKYEDIVKNIELSALDICLSSGVEGTVIVDDTNLNPKTLNNIMKVCNQRGAEIELKSFLDVSPMECIARDLNRDNSVGSNTILRMAKAAQDMKKLLKL